MDTSIPAFYIQIYYLRLEIFTISDTMYFIFGINSKKARKKMKYPDRDILYVEENVLKEETFKTTKELNQKKLTGSNVEHVNINGNYGLKYKGYNTTIYYSPENKIFFGKLENIKGLVNFEAPTIKKAKEEFEKAVDDYIIFKKEIK